MAISILHFPHATDCGQIPSTDDGIQALIRPTTLTGTAVLNATAEYPCFLGRTSQECLNFVEVVWVAIMHPGLA